MFIFLTTGATIILSYSSILDGYGRNAGILFIFFSALSLYPVYRYSMKMAPGPAANSRAGNTGRIISLMIIAAILSIVLFRRISGLGDESILLPQSTYFARVERVIDRRYDQEVSIHFRLGGTDAVIPNDKPAWYRGIAYISDESNLNVGNEVKIAGKPVSVARSGARSPIHRMLLSRGIQYVFYLKSDAVSVVASGKTVKKRMRDRLSASCDALFGKETSSVVKALYFGNQYYIDKHILNDFKRAGVLHILAASGLHVGVVAAIPLFVLGLFRLNRKCIFVATAVVVALYLYITDMPVSLIRASIMFMIYALHRIANREVNIINALFLSAIIILAMFPHEIYSLGFQLSFGATLGILLFHRLYRRVFSYLPPRISDSLALTISAQAPVIPVLLVQVGEINLSGVISNIIVVPAMSLLLVVSLAANGLFIVTAHAVLIGNLADTIFAVNKSVIGFISGLDCHFKVAAVHPALFAAFGLLILPLLPWFSRRKVMSLSIASAFAVAWILLGSLQAPDRDNRLITHNRGSALLVREGTSLAVIGSLPDMNQMELVTSAIGKTGCREITLYIPMPDYPNIAGYSYLAKRFPVRHCYLSDKFPIRKYIKKFFKILDRDGVGITLYDFNAPAGAAGTALQTAGMAAAPDRACVLYKLLAR